MVVPKPTFEKDPASYRAVLALRARSPKRVQNESKRVPGPPVPGAQKVQKEPEKSQNESKRVIFDSFRALFGLFGPLGPETLFDSFLTLLGLRARRAQNGSVAGGGFLKPTLQNNMCLRVQCGRAKLQGRGSPRDSPGFPQQCPYHMLVTLGS